MKVVRPEIAMVGELVASGLQEQHETSIVVGFSLICLSGCGASGFVQSQTIFSAENGCRVSETRADEIGDDI